MSLPFHSWLRGKKGRVAYIYAPESNQLQKLMAMGVLPGAPISLIQSFPSYVFQIRRTQFAVDKEVAEAIYVRLVKQGAIDGIHGEQSLKHRRGFGLGRRFGRWLKGS